MAKSTYLELCQTVIRECGITGTLSAVTGNTGMLNKVVHWVADADLETQSRWFDWDFLHVSTWSANTVIGTAAVAAPATLGVWDVDSFYLNYSLATNSSLTVLDYKDWRKNYRQGVKTNDEPSNVVIKPDQSLILEPPPDAIYSLTADYWKRPAKPTLTSDTSPIPEEYERIIVARAMMFYAIDTGSNEIMVSAQIEYDDLLDKLEAKYLPNQVGRRMSDAGQMTVRVE